jgi:MSHA pilin protein MshD
MRRNNGCRRGGFTLVETSISTLIVGIVLVASMRTVVGVTRHRSVHNDATTANLLAESLLTEILEKEYKEPTATPIFGAETGETGSRSLFDDVDDYHGWTETPPKHLDGSSMSALSGWSREVAVTQVGTSDPIFSTTIRTGTSIVGEGLDAKAEGTDTGVRKVTVTVKKSGTTLATVTGLKTDSP